MGLHGTVFKVSATADLGVVSSDTSLAFTQRGDRVLGRYHGGSIRRGLLVGELAGGVFGFRYAQVENDGHVHGGQSICDLESLPDGRLRLHEHFTWETREGAGTNVFDQVRG